jgi:hypothetical protein
VIGKPRVQSWVNPRDAERAERRDKWRQRETGLVVKSLAKDAALAPGPVKEVRLLGYKGRIQWAQTDEGLVVTLPDKSPCDYAVTLKIWKRDVVSD